MRQREEKISLENKASNVHLKISQPRTKPCVHGLLEHIHTKILIVHMLRHTYSAHALSHRTNGIGLSDGIAGKGVVTVESSIFMPVRG